MRTTLLRLACGLAALALGVDAARGQTHTTDFSKSDSPNGLSRRGYASGTSGSGYQHGSTDWFQQFWGGAYRVRNPNSSKFVCVDYGCGRGGTVLPAPLVQGGPFCVAPLAGFEPDHGPYAVPFSFEADFDAWEDFADAGLYSGNDVPAAFPSSLPWKACGITLELVNLESGGEVVRQVTLGTFQWSGAPITLPIYDNSFPELPGGPPMPTLSVQDPSLGWKLKVAVRSGRLGLYAAVDGNPLPGEPIATSAQAAPGVPWNVQRVRSAALRIAGVVNGNEIAVQRVQIQSANIPSYDGTPPAVALVQSGEPIVRRVGSELIRHGQLRAMGVNCVNLLDFFAGFGTTAEYGEWVLDQLASASELRAVRFSAGGVNSTYIKDWSSSVPGWPRVNYPLLELFESDPQSYFAAFDRLVNAATARGILLVPSLVWGPHNAYSYANDLPKAAVTQGQVLGTFGLPGGDTGPDIDDARSRMEAFVAAVTAHYRDHPTIAFWEVGNEWDNLIDRSTNPLSFGTLSGCWNPSWQEFWPSPADCAGAQDVVAQVIRGAAPAGGDDQNHLIGSGYSGTAQHFLDPGTNLPSQTAFENAMRAYYADSIDLASVHIYVRDNSGQVCPAYEPFASWNDYLLELRRVAHDLHPQSGDAARALYVGETNWKYNTSDPYDPVIWQGYLDAVTGAAVTGADPRPSLSMLWQWMNAVQFDNPEDDPYDTVPDDINDPGHAMSLFNQTAGSFFAAPWVLAAGYHEESGVHTIEAEVADLQGDVSEVRLLDDAGVLQAQLTDQGGGVWSTAVPLPGMLNPPQQFKFRIEASDGSHVSTQWPRFIAGSAAPGSFPATNAPPLVGGGPTAPDYAVVRRAGFEGFDHLSVEGGRMVITAQVEYPGGLTPGASTLVLARLSMPDPYDLVDWTTQGASFPFADDGNGADEVAGDGIYTFSIDADPTLAAQLAGAEYFFEIVAVTFPPGGGYTISDIWPYVTVR